MTTTFGRGKQVNPAAGSQKKRNAKQFTKDILDELDKPKIPERQAYEVQKDAADHASLERFYEVTGQITPEKVMERALDELADTIERMDPSGEFDPIALPIRIMGRNRVLRFAKSPSKSGNTRRTVDSDRSRTIDFIKMAR